MHAIHSKFWWVLVEKNTENLILGPFLPLNAKVRAPRFFFKNRASSLFFTPWTLTSCKKSKKTNEGKYENFCCRRTDGRKDRQSDRAGFQGSASWVGGSKTPCQAFILPNCYLKPTETHFWLQALIAGTWYAQSATIMIKHQVICSIRLDLPWRRTHCRRTYWTPVLKMLPTWKENETWTWNMTSWSKVSKMRSWRKVSNISVGSNLLTLLTNFTDKLWPNLLTYGTTNSNQLAQYINIFPVLPKVEEACPRRKLLEIFYLNAPGERKSIWYDVPYFYWHFPDISPKEPF